MTTELSQLKVANDLRQLQSQNVSGILRVKHEKPDYPDWELYVYLGRLTYATGGMHRARRWIRAVRLHCDINNLSKEWFATLNDLQSPWEIDVLTRAVIENKITSDQAKQVIQSSIREVFLTIVDQKIVETKWEEKEATFRPLVVISAEQVLQNIATAKAKWQEAGLSHVQNMISGFSFELAPVVVDNDRFHQVLTTGAYPNLEKLVNGKNTLWDLSFLMQKSMIAVMRSLLPLVLDGIVEFREVPDIALPFLSRVSAKATKRGVIACIDDSPQIGQTLAAILNPHGYETIVITDPLQGVSTLLQKKPDLIFLDLVMPNTNGYELCTFLRKTSQFQEVPIVILTGHDGVVDRVRAKLAGSTDFVSKPPEEEKVLQIIQKYIKK
ncbi:MAG: response regulator [Pseudanabaenaceae cyanobacterium SKYGB_i_bin29]|nr:response regulator [Pseudanabaenaceae cyanobacterium SKYG29]MDW8420922.1 response regulator [Pseudanabaenaceae cyanobacterium SKYGB_i_bin29]